MRTRERNGTIMIRFALPDLIRSLELNLTIAGMMKSAPEMFYDDVSLSSLYGCFPGCSMNGGRIMDGVPYSYDRIAETFDRISEAGLGVRLTFTNMFVRPEHFEDEYSNQILKAAQGHQTEVIVYSDELGEYIAEHYHFRRILSTTRKLNGVEELNAMLGRYDMVVLDYNHNKDDLFLGQVSDPTRLEVMPNEACVPGCPFRQQHYEHDSRCQLENRFDVFRCPNTGCAGPGYTSRAEESRTILSNDDIRRLNTTYGISDFKIVGRRGALEFILEAYLYYLVRPEYRNTVGKILGRQLRPQS